MDANLHLPSDVFIAYQQLRYGPVNDFVPPAPGSAGKLIELRFLLLWQSHFHTLNVGCVFGRLTTAIAVPIVRARSRRTVRVAGSHPFP